MTTKDAATERRDPRPSDWEIADAIEILSMCEPICDIQGGMWFSRNHNLADATFVDYGACRAFARAARALPHLVDERASLLAKNADLIKALEEIERTDWGYVTPQYAIDPTRIRTDIEKARGRGNNTPYMGQYAVLAHAAIGKARP
jgi:hypothetical protein